VARLQKSQLEHLIATLARKCAKLEKLKGSGGELQIALKLLEEAQQEEVAVWLPGIEKPLLDHVHLSPRQPGPPVRLHLEPHTDADGRRCDLFEAGVGLGEPFDGGIVGAAIEGQLDARGAA